MTSQMPQFSRQEFRIIISPAKPKEAGNPQILLPRISENIQNSEFKFEFLLSRKRQVVTVILSLLLPE